MKKSLTIPFEEMESILTKSTIAILLNLNIRTLEKVKGPLYLIDMSEDVMEFIGVRDVDNGLMVLDRFSLNDHILQKLMEDNSLFWLSKDHLTTFVEKSRKLLISK